MLRKIIITSGPTKEWIDPVRYISNSSSGKMGYQIAISAMKVFSGNSSQRSKDESEMEIVYISGGTLDEYKTVANQDPRISVRNVSVETTLDLLSAVVSEIQNDCLLVMASAPADYRIANPSLQKIKKIPKSNELNLILIENPDILKTVAERKKELELKNFFALGFSAETENLEENALGKLERKGLDWIAANLVGKSIGFGEVDSTIYLYGKSGKRWTIGPLPKDRIAHELVQIIQNSIPSS